MWYLAISALAIILISIENSKRSKFAYILLAIGFPTVAYSLWRVNSEHRINSNFSAVLRLSVWFMICHSFLSLAWAFDSFYLSPNPVNLSFVIPAVWGVVVIISALVALCDRFKIKKSKFTPKLSIFSSTILR